MLYTAEVKLETTLTVQIEADTENEAEESAHDAALGLLNEPERGEWFNSTIVSIKSTEQT